jgi:hypothetical protein
MLLYDMPYNLLGYFNYFNLYLELLQVIIGYDKLLYFKVLHIIIL